MNVLLPPDALVLLSQEAVYINLQLISVFTLLLLLLGRELVVNAQPPFARWRRVSMIGVAPLLVAFLLILLWHIARSA